MTQPLPLGTLLDRLAADQQLTRADLTSPNRARSLARVRFAFAWVARHAFNAGWAKMGRVLGGRCRQTMMNACRRGTQLRERDPAFRDLTDRFLALMTEATDRG